MRDVLRPGSSSIDELAPGAPARTRPAERTLLVPIAHPSVAEQAARFLAARTPAGERPVHVECGVAAVVDGVVVATALLDDESLLHPVVDAEDRELLVALIDRVMRHAARSGITRIRVRASALRPTTRRRLRHHGIHHAIASDGMVDLFVTPSLSHSA